MKTNPNIKFLQQFIVVNFRTLWLFAFNRIARRIIVDEWHHERHMAETGRPMVDAVMDDCFKSNRKPRRKAGR
ncbi:MAG TPA: hypothetical protein EYQ50_16515 [Verrucomicrobiales bacterium]|nr:hypothetical protein [Verrucomicrobiales bacterium]